MSRKYSDWEVQQWYEHRSCFLRNLYYNPDETNIIVPKKRSRFSGYSYTFNFGNPKGILAFLIMIFLIIFPVLFLVQFD